MKYLSDYMENKQTDTFNKNGAFFAFSDEQFNKQKKEGVDYISLGAGLITPKKNAGALTRELHAIYADAVKQDLEENGVKAIINRELANHECQITGDITDAVEKLKDYKITREQIQAEYSAYFQMCIDNDYF